MNDLELDKLIDRAWNVGLEPSHYTSNEELLQVVVEAEK
jgi:hypothetical protein